jgi:glucokinase
LAQAIYGLIMTYDPDKIVIGGGVSSAGETFMKPVEEALSAMRNRSPLAERVLSRERVFLLPSDYKAGAWGAIELARWASSKGARIPAGKRDDYLTSEPAKTNASKP